MDWIGGEQGLVERLSDGVGALPVAPGLPPTRNDSIESKAPNSHEAWVKWDGLIQGRGDSARCGGVDVGDVVGSA